MKLKVLNRKKGPEGTSNRLRREGKIPAVLYRSGEETQQLVIEATQWQALLRQIPQGSLATTLFELEIEGKKVRALVKEVQYDPTTYSVIHIDLLAVGPESVVRVRVPLRCTGTAQCAGVRLGGILRQVMRAIPVRCKPDAIPDELVVDVRDLGIRQGRRLRDITFPAGVSPLMDLNEVAVVVAKR
jgi:large subunit ribosomal protein L25